MTEDNAVIVAALALGLSLRLIVCTPAPQDKCPDVIALQEVYEAKHFNAVKSALEATHPHVARSVAPPICAIHAP